MVYIWGRSWYSVFTKRYSLRRQGPRRLYFYLRHELENFFRLLQIRIFRIMSPALLFISLNQNWVTMGLLYNISLYRTGQAAIFWTTYFTSSLSRRPLRCPRSQLRPHAHATKIYYKWCPRLSSVSIQYLKKLNVTRWSDILRRSGPWLCPLALSCHNKALSEQRNISSKLYTILRKIHTKSSST